MNKERRQLIAKAETLISAARALLEQDRSAGKHAQVRTSRALCTCNQVHL